MEAQSYKESTRYNPYFHLVHSTSLAKFHVLFEKYGRTKQNFYHWVKTSRLEKHKI